MRSMSLNLKSRWALAALSFVLCTLIAAVSWAAYPGSRIIASGTTDVNVTIPGTPAAVQLVATGNDAVFSVHAWNGTVYRLLLPDSTRIAATDTMYPLLDGIPYTVEMDYPNRLSNGDIGNPFSEITVCITRATAAKVVLQVK